MTTRPDDLPEELRALVDEERRAAPPAGVDPDAVHARLLTSIAALPMVPGVELAQPAQNAAAQSAATQGAASSTATTAASATATSTAAATSGAAVAPWIIISTVGVVSVSAGVAYFATDRDPVVAPVVQPATTPPAVMEEEEPVVIAEPPAPSPRRARPPVLSPLEQEEKLLELARTAMSVGRTETASTLLDEHHRQFSDGQLAEERDALRVLVLKVAGNAEAANRAAEAFRTAYPKSLHLPRIERALRQR